MASTCTQVMCVQEQKIGANVIDLEQGRRPTTTNDCVSDDDEPPTGQMASGGSTSRSTPMLGCSYPLLAYLQSFLAVCSIYSRVIIRIYFFISTFTRKYWSYGVLTACWLYYVSLNSRAGLSEQPVNQYRITPVEYDNIHAEHA